MSASSTPQIYQHKANIQVIVKYIYNYYRQKLIELGHVRCLSGTKDYSTTVQPTPKMRTVQSSGQKRKLETAAISNSKLKRFRGKRDTHLRMERVSSPGAKGLSRADGLALFHAFLYEVIKGPRSQDPLLNLHALGGLCLFAVDSIKVVEEFWPVRKDAKQLVWRLLFVVWLGAGGPNFATYAEMSAKGLIPEPEDKAGMRVFYRAIEQLVKDRGVRKVFGGDSLFVR
eukprot:gnl/MRDRNA2_/MRDRNA2_254118_c0_seq1.p1 gnl/MRDRNA2_/MRDRNA2_254118_c0~~gnl/MRDRNA2_/MRDRNA2_254118_c0_seq1.p1  ORF type:complete len:228 (+),score=39.91 gnl/MRDRNA2_/MRDRNA2_254118_c0_seq1:331-1014(+)